MIINRIKLAKALLALAEIKTDKANLIYEGDLTEGTEVFVELEGEVVAAEDGEYVADEKTITVKDGKVESIKIKEEIEEPKDEDEPKDEPIEMSAKDKFNAVKAQFEASYQEIARNIDSALAELGIWGYLIENGNDYAIVSVWDEETEKEHLYRYEISIDEDGFVTLGERIEVRIEYVPINEEPKEDTVNEELAAKDARIAELEAEIAKQKEQLEMSDEKPAEEKIKQNEVTGALRYFA